MKKYIPSINAADSFSRHQYPNKIIMVKQLTAVKQKILVKGEHFWADTQTKTEGSKGNVLDYADSVFYKYRRCHSCIQISFRKSQGTKHLSHAQFS